jgi:nucleoid-associated protein YgaU
VFVKALLLAATAIILWTIAARPLGAHGERQLYRVQAYDTLWSIATAHYAGDARDGVWRIEQANHLAGATIRPGEVIVLP